VFTKAAFTEMRYGREKVEMFRAKSLGKTKARIFETSTDTFDCLLSVLRDIMKFFKIRVFSKFGDSKRWQILQQANFSSRSNQGFIRN